MKKHEKQLRNALHTAFENAVLRGITVKRALTIAQQEIDKISTPVKQAA